MRPTKLVLHNWCQHTSLELTFVEGMNSIVGSNGSGKTNILRALSLAICQETNSKGKKTDDIQDGCSTARINLLFEHADKQGVITVNLSRNYFKNWGEMSLDIEMAQQAAAANASDPTVAITEDQLKLATLKPRETIKYSLEYEGLVTAEGKPNKLTKAGDILNWIQEATGVDPKAIRSNFFPSQGDVDGALSGDRETRTRIFAEKAGTQYCAMIHKELGDIIKTENSFADLDDDLKEANALLAAREGQLAQAQSEFEAVKDLVTDPGESAQIVSKYQEATNAQSRIEQFNQSTATQQARMGELRDSIAALEKEGKELSQISESGKEAHEDRKKKIIEANLAAQSASQRQQAETNLQSAQERRQGLQMPPALPEGLSHENAQQLANTAATLRAEAKQLDDFIEPLRGGTCPVCHQPVENLADEYQAKRDAIDFDTPQQQAQSISSAVSAWETANAEYNRASAELDALIANLQAEIARIPASAATDPNFDVNAEQALVNEYDANEARLGQTRQQYTASVQEYQALENQLASATGSIKELEVQLEGAPTIEQFQAASQAITDTATNRSKVNDAQVALQTSKNLVEESKQSVAKLEERIASQEKQREYVALLQEARDMLHRDELPAEVLAWYISLLVEHTQTNLDMFDMDFQLAMAPDMGLMGIFSDKSMPAERFSGGEKNATNISMRVAMTDMFPSDLRLLILDEVEVHLDQERIARLPAILENVKAIARNRGLVVIFISHHPALMDIADQCHYTSAA